MRGPAAAYAARAVPWVAVLVGSVVVAGLLVLVTVAPAALWPLQGTAAGVVVAVAALAMDEPAAGVADVAPRTLAWRTAVRAAAVVPVLLVSWCAPVLVRAERFPHVPVLLLEGLGAAAAGAGLAVAARRGGVPEPGARVAAAAVPLAAALALVRPGAQHVPVFPVWPADRWGVATGLWWTLTVAGAATVVLACALRPRPAVRRAGGAP